MMAYTLSVRSVVPAVSRVRRCFLQAVLARHSNLLSAMWPPRVCDATDDQGRSRLEEAERIPARPDSRHSPTVGAARTAGLTWLRAAEAGGAAPMNVAYNSASMRVERNDGNSARCWRGSSNG